VEKKPRVRRREERKRENEKGREMLTGWMIGKMCMKENGIGGRESMLNLKCGGRV
jgi:hypothetical protein